MARSFLAASLVAAVFCSNLLAVPAEARTYRVRHKPNIRYHRGLSPAHLLDVYVPRGVKKAPVVFFVHGGGWSWFGPDPLAGFNKDKYIHVGRALAKRGMVAVLPNYRLSPVNKHPTHIKDLARALRWVTKHIHRYGGSRKKVFVSGHSAGGHLAALLSLNTRYLRGVGVKQSSIRGVVPVSGVYEISGKTPLEKGAFPKKLVRDASPIRFVEGHPPPFLILFADKDPKAMRSGARDFYKVFVRRRLKAKLKRLPGRDHLSVMTGSLVPEKIRDFIRKTLR